MGSIVSIKQQYVPDHCRTAMYLLDLGFGEATFIRKRWWGAVYFFHIVFVCHFTFVCNIVNLITWHVCSLALDGIPHVSKAPHRSY